MSDPPLLFPSSSLPSQTKEQLPPGDPTSLGLNDLSLIEKARALCAAADNVQKATLEASERIAAIHGSPRRQKLQFGPRKPVKEPPDVCARPRSDVPPPRGQGWKRLGEVSVVQGSDQILAPAPTRRGLTRDIEIFVNGGQYCIMPGDTKHCVGSSVTLDRDYEGETNMASMLYVRKRAGSEVRALKACKSSVPSTTVITAPSQPVPMEATRAPFRSVGETGPPRPSPSTLRPTLLVRESDLLGSNQPEDDVDGRIASVHDAQRRARRRVLAQQRRALAKAESNRQPKKSHKPTLAEIERLKASRRAALARVAFQRQQETSRREELERAEQNQQREKEAETRARKDGLRNTAVARAAMAAADMRRRERQHLDAREIEAAGKMQRLAALMTAKDAEVLERERRLRTETYLRIRRKERRRELAERQRAEEQAERLQQYETRRSTSVPNAPDSCRSFFAITEEAESAEGEPGDRELVPRGSVDYAKDNQLTKPASSLSHPGSARTPGSHKVLSPLDLSKVQPKAHGSEVPRGRSCSLRSPAKQRQPTALREHFRGDTVTGRDFLGSEDSHKGSYGTPVFSSPTMTALSSGAARSSSGATGDSRGSGGTSRRKISTTPVWKRPAVPLSKPYVPVPRREDGIFGVR